MVDITSRPGRRIIPVNYDYSRPAITGADTAQSSRQLRARGPIGGSRAGRVANQEAESHNVAIIGGLGWVDRMANKKCEMRNKRSIKLSLQPVVVGGVESVVGCPANLSSQRITSVTD